MGVRGLTTYINYNQDAFLEAYYLYESALVIDGHSLCAQLYRSLNCFSAFGGDYDKFASYVKTFFKNLRKCAITPYVLFDGSYEKRKIKTAYNRLRSKIYGASKLDPVTQGSLQIFPLLLRDVFKEALQDLMIPFSICEFEADDELAALARHLNCPVLSYDSDFFIYNVLYIPFNTVDMKPKQLIDDGVKFFALECKIYRVQTLIENFGGLKEEMLPLLATLLGNDFVEKRVFNKFFSQLKLPKSKKKVNEQQRCIHGLFKWLQNETLETALSKILGRLKKKQRDKVFAIIKRSIEGYNSRYCRSLQYFDICQESEEVSQMKIPENLNNIIEDKEIYDPEENSNNNSEKEDDNEFDNLSVEENNLLASDDDVSDADSSSDDLIRGVPDWFAEGIRQFYIPQGYLNLYTHHLHFCSPQAEDYHDEDSFLCALPILRYAFDLLTDYSYENVTYVSREKNTGYRRLCVGQEFSFRRLIDEPFSDLDEEQLKLCFYHFIKEKMPLLDMEHVASLPENLQLIMVSIFWWVSTCDVSISNVHSLLICYIMLEVIDRKIDSVRGHYHFNNKFSKRINEWKKIDANDIEIEKDLNKIKVKYEDCVIAAGVLLENFELCDKIKKKPKSYDVKRTHSFAQFQCCLQQFNYLNSLCRKPLQATKFSKSFNGTFVYNMGEKLENQMDISQFMNQYFKGASTILSYYKSIIFIYEKFVGKMGLVMKQCTGKKKKRRKYKNINDEIDFIVKGFESEVLL